MLFVFYDIGSSIYNFCSFPSPWQGVTLCEHFDMTLTQGRFVLQGDMYCLDTCWHDRDFHNLGDFRLFYLIVCSPPPIPLLSTRLFCLSSVISDDVLFSVMTRRDSRLYFVHLVSQINWMLILNCPIGFLKSCLHLREWHQINHISLFLSQIDCMLRELLKIYKIVLFFVFDI